MPKEKGTRHTGIYINGDKIIRTKLTTKQMDVFDDFDFNFRTRKTGGKEISLKPDFIYYFSKPLLKAQIKEKGGTDKDYNNSINQTKDFILQIRQGIVTNTFNELGFATKTDIKRYLLTAFGYSPKKSEKIIEGKDKDLNHIFKVVKKKNKLEPYTIVASKRTVTKPKDEYFAYHKNKLIGNVNKTELNEIKKITENFFKSNQLNDLLKRILKYTKRDILNSYNKNVGSIGSKFGESRDRKGREKRIIFNMTYYFPKKEITYAGYKRLLNDFETAKKILSIEDIKQYQAIINLANAIRQTQRSYNPKEKRPNLQIGKSRGLMFELNPYYKKLMPNFKSQVPFTNALGQEKFRRTREFSEEDKEDFVDNAGEILEDMNDKMNEYKKDKKDENNKIINKLVDGVEKKIIEIIKS